MMFGRRRACGGFNNNPNVCTFKGAFRKIQCNMKMDLSDSSNCRMRMFDTELPDNLFFSNIYFVSSKRAKIVMNEDVYENQRDSILEAVDIPEDEFIDSFDSPDTFIDANHHMLDGTSNFMIIYSASKIEKKIMACKSFHCNNCRLVFGENEKIDSIDLCSTYLSWKYVKQHH